MNFFFLLPFGFGWNDDGGVEGKYENFAGAMEICGTWAVLKDDKRSIYVDLAYFQMSLNGWAGVGGPTGRESAGMSQ